MSEICSVNALLHSSPRSGFGNPFTPATEDGNVAVADRVEISDLARVLSAGLVEPDIRIDKVAEVRAAIASDAYLSEDRLHFAIGRAIDEALSETTK